MPRRSWNLPTRFARNGSAGEDLNIAAEMMRLALQITARTLFDTEVTPEIHEINDQVNIIMDLYHFLVTLPRAELLLNSPLPQMRRFRAAKKRLDEVVDRHDPEARQRRYEPAASAATCFRCCWLRATIRAEETG